MRKRIVTRFAKKCLAYSLATVTIATSALGGLTFMQEPVVVEAATADMLSNEERGVIYANSRTDFRDETIYFLITTRFYDGDTSNNCRTPGDDSAGNSEDDPSWRGDFKGLIDKLDYIKALGFTAIWITPVVENDSDYDYHGYHAYNFNAVDTRYESNGVTYQTLIDAVHAKGMKIIQDIDINSTSSHGEKNLLQITSDIVAERNQIIINGEGDSENIYHHNGFCSGSDWDNYERQITSSAAECFDLETENPKVYNYLVDCYKKYIDMGVDSFRINAAMSISRLTLNTVLLPELQKAGGEEFYMFGEVPSRSRDIWYNGVPPLSTSFYTWDDSSEWKSRWSDSLASNEELVEEHYNANMDTSTQPTSENAFLNGNEYHTPDYSQKSNMDVIDFQMHWEFGDARKAFSKALEQDRYFNDSTWNVVYVDSHDYAPDGGGSDTHFRYIGGTDNWAENLSLMFTFRGIPCIYYGSEIEFQAGKVIDSGYTTPLADTGRAYFGDHIEGSVETEDFTVFGNLSGEVQNTLNSTLSQHIMRLNRLRQAIPALRKGQYSIDGCIGNGMAFKRRYADSTTDSFALVTISGSATFSGIPNGKYIDAVTGDIQNVTNGVLTARVSGKGNMKVYVLDTEKTPAPGRVIPNGDFLNDGGAAELIGPSKLNIIEATNITLSQSSVSLMQAKTAKITATVEPSNATDKTVKWTSSDESVATVSNGVVTGVAPGTAVITVATSNGKTSTATVTVTKKVEIVELEVTATASSPSVAVGSSITITAVAKGGSGSYRYSYIVHNITTNKWARIEDKSTSNTLSWKAISEGTRKFYVDVTDETGKTVRATVGTVKVTGEANNSKTKYIYFEKPDEWESAINVYMYSIEQQIYDEWPGSKMEDIGNGVYAIELKNAASDTKLIFNDGAGKQTEDLDYVNNGYYTSEGLSHIVDPIDELEVTASASSTSVDVGSSITITATASGGAGSYKYSYIVHNKTTGKWARIKDKSTSNTLTWNAISEGIRDFYVDVTDANGTTIRSSVMTVVTEKEAPMTVVGTATTSSTTVGNTVTITGIATGGSGTYTYSFIVYNQETDRWFRYAFGSSNNLTWKANSKGTRKFFVEAKDSNGKIIRSDKIVIKVK